MNDDSILFINAKVWQPEGRYDEAFGINGNKIVFTGSNNQALQNKSNYNNVIDLEGKLVLPGLIDGHVHLCYGSLMLKQLDARNVNSPGELKNEIEIYLKRNPSTDWVIGSNIDLNKVFKNHTSGSGNIADEIYREKPLYIVNYDYHSALCNTPAIIETGMSEKINEFSDSEIIKDVNGKPAGIVKEKAQKYMYTRLPEPSMEHRCTALKDFIKVLHSYGITEIADITAIKDLDVYIHIYNNNELNIRIKSYIPLQEFKNTTRHINKISDLDPAIIKIKGYKAYYDGSLGSETALFSKNYKGKKHNGYKTDIVTSGTLSELSRKIDKQGGQMIIHAIGDLAVTEVLDLYEQIIKENGSRDSRHRIEHAQHVSEADIERFSRLGVIASVQPLHLKYDIGLVKNKLPEEIVNSTHIYKKIIDAGGIINFGTDFPVVEINPFENIKMAMTRITGAEAFTPEFCIDLHNCLKAYTYNNVYSNFNEDTSGSIAAGKYADFVIMEDDLFEMNPEDMGKAKVWKTYFNGEQVWGG